jgi:hypothetical protein
MKPTMTMTQFGKRHKLYMATLIICCSPIVTIHAQEPSELPAFIQMNGVWESKATRSDPEDLLQMHPELANLHKITGVPTVVRPGIRFLVEQLVNGVTSATEITYHFDPISRQSFGIIAVNNGPVLRGVIQHGDAGDVLRIYAPNDDLVSTERSHWISEREFQSEATFEVDGRTVTVWYRTYRKSDSTDP